jgi:hypothetical protein
MCYWNFSLTYSFRPHYGPGVDSATIRNEYQGCFLGVKTADAYGHLHAPIVLKLGSLNLLEPSGPVQAYNGIALPLPILLHGHIDRAVTDLKINIEFGTPFCFTQKRFKPQSFARSLKSI